MLKFNTPDEQEELFRKHKKLTRSYQEDRGSFPAMKLAILTGVTVHPLKDIIEAMLLDSGFNPTIFEGGYNAYEFESRFSEELVEFQPDTVYVHTTIDNLVLRPEIAADDAAAQSLVERHVSSITGTVDALLERCDAHIIINTIELPNYRINGNFEAVAPGGLVRFVHEINERIVGYSRKNARVSINDINYLSSKVGLEKWRDDHSYAAFKQPLTRRGLTEVARSVVALLLSSKGKAGKCLVVDLDNTMWGGIIGDDGVENVEIGPETAKGEGYRAFQTAIKPLLGRGIAFGVCSKNEEATGLAGLNREEMVLKEADFHAIRINWNQKSENLKALKQIFNVGYDAIMFIDDSEFERSEVRYNLPDLKVPEVIPDPWDYIRAISDSYAFETLTLTQEDLMRGESFRSMAVLSDKVDSGAGIDEFLSSLEMSAEIATVTEATRSRVYQLINKTNQFNLTAQRVTEADVQNHLNDQRMLTASLKDRNSDYGLVSVLWGSYDGPAFTLENWVMSCRVFNRKLEFHFFQDLCARLETSGITKINARFVPSKKNMPVAGLLEKLGFDLVSEDADGTDYELDLLNRSSDLADEIEGLYK